MEHQDIHKITCELQKDMSLRNLYRITCNHGEEIGTVWVEDGHECSMSYARMAKLADAYTAYFQSMIPDSGYVAVMMETRREWFPTFWGLIRSGHSVLLLDAGMDDRMCRHLLDETGCTMLITERKRKLPDRYLQFSAKDVFACDPAGIPKEQTWGDLVALCTSGTTGSSRVYVYDGNALCHQCLASDLVYQENTRLIDSRNIRCMAFLPFHHVLGFVANLLWCSFLGYATIYIKERTPNTILKTAQICKPNMLITVPLLCNHLCNGIRKQIAEQPMPKRLAFDLLCNLSLLIQKFAPDKGGHFAEKHLFASILNKLLGTEMDALVIGGGYTPTENIRLLTALGYYCVNGYGMTETGITSMETSMKLSDRFSGSIGKPLTSAEYRQRNIENGVGEMVIASKCLHVGRMQGGRMLPAETEDGWYATGDLIRITDNGRVYIVGRCKDVIINESGENVYPDELENMLRLPESIGQYTVLGIRKGESLYEDITLAVWLGKEKMSDELIQAMIQNVREVNQKVPTLKRISRLLISAEPLPMASGIKVKRAELKEKIEKKRIPLTEVDLRSAKCQEQEAAPDVANEMAPNNRIDPELLTQVQDLAAKAFGLKSETLDVEADFIEDLGGDSLQLLTLMLSLEEQVGITVEPSEYGRCSSVKATVQVLSEKLHGVSADAKRLDQKETVEPITSFEETPEYQEFSARLEQIMKQGEDNPYFVAYNSPLLDESDMEGRRVLNFGSYNYVGMSGRKEVNEAAKKAIDIYGTSASGSRLLAGEKNIHKELEAEIADWKHTEDAIVCVGGHSTNVTFVGNFCGPKDLIVYDALAHNSIEQGCRLSRSDSRPFPHNNADALEAILKMHRSRYEKVLIVIEGAYSMDGDIADVPAFVALKKKYGCFLMVDEAHSACVIGETGGGVDEYFSLNGDDIDIKMGTLSKGLGTCGGYLAGKHSLINYLRYSMPGFVFSVGISPALAAGSLAALRTLRQNPSIMENMRRNIECFASEAKKRNLDICLAGKTAVLPVLVGKDEDAVLLSNALRRKGICVPPAVYPAVPRNKARLRFCVISEHKPEQIILALDTLMENAKELKIVLPQPVCSREIS